MDNIDRFETLANMYINDTCCDGQLFCGCRNEDCQLFKTEECINCLIKHIRGGNEMKRVIITLELEDDKFEEMEKVLLNNGCPKDRFQNWDAHVIETYNKTVRYLECNGGDLNRAYRDMIYDF